MSRKVKALLIERGIKQVDIAAALGVSKTTVSPVVAGKRQSRRIKVYIADLLGMDYQKLWGKAA